MEKKHGEGGEIIDLVKKRRERDEKEAVKKDKQNKLEEPQNNEGKLGGILFAEHEGRNHPFDVDMGLLSQGWKVCNVTFIDEDLIQKKQKALAAIGYKNVVTRKSKYYGSNRPILVFYGKH